MEIEKKLFHDLVEKLTHVPLAKATDGRTTLLVGIPHESWQRSENITIDITHIINHSKEVFIGEKEELENWGLLFVIDNAINAVKGTSLATNLRALRQECVRCWEKEHTKLTSLTEAQPIHETLTQTISIDPVSNENNILSFDPIEREEVLITLETIVPTDEDNQADLHVLFFNKSSAYIINIQKSISTAFTPFKDRPSGYAEPADCRKSINHLKRAKEDLPGLATLIDSTNQLPLTIAKQQSTLMEQIQFLANQIQLLIERIDQGCKTDKEIKGKFIIIEKELARFTPLMSHDQKKETS